MARAVGDRMMTKRMVSSHKSEHVGLAGRVDRGRDAEGIMSRRSVSICAETAVRLRVQVVIESIGRGSVPQ